MLYAYDNVALVTSFTQKQDINVMYVLCDLTSLFTIINLSFVRTCMFMNSYVVYMSTSFLVI